MDIFSMQFLSALVAIVIIDLVLAGDNAIVIGLAARNLPGEMQKKAVFWGAIGAVVIRALMTLIVVWLLKIPGLMMAGGLALIWIAYQLMEENDGGGHEHVAAASSFRQAIQTIVIADAVMGVDNVLAVAGAAHGSFLLVILGLLISIPIVMWGSTLILKWVERYPVIIVFGAAVLAWTAAKMITGEKLVADFFVEHHGWKVAVFVFLIGAIVAVPLMRRARGRIGVLPVCLVFLVVWLGVFDYLEEYVGGRYFPSGEEPLAVELIDLVMWIGWIPFVIAIQRELTPRPKSAPKGAA